jgi:ATP-dependent DNA helicase RecQ
LISFVDRTQKYKTPFIVDKYRKILKDYWGYDDFRPMQHEIVSSVGSGHDTLGLLPTGGGKSITFQVPSLAQDGICIVVTPLIALMKDQVYNLKKQKIRALAIYSGLSRDEIDTALNNCIYGDYKFLYVSPERLNTELFRIRVQGMNVNLIAIDEAHCISQWGYDFRPAYLEIANLRDLLPNVPFLALTATATPKVVEDIMDKLQFKERNLFQKSFERKNLVYWVKHSDDKINDLTRICQRSAGTGVVYVRSRRRTREIAEHLQRNGISADYYHAGLNAQQRDTKQEEWKSDKTRIIVSTNAFGMGIDKPNVRFVVHIDLPDSLEAYFQEAGRGGRDEKKAYGILLYHKSDHTRLKQTFTNAFPEIKFVKKVYKSLGNYYGLPAGSGKGTTFDFILADFAKTYKFSMIQAYNSLKVLQTEGYIELTDSIHNPSKLKFLIHRDELYEFQVANVAFDRLIKLILRSYTGLFTDFVAIDELMLAKRIKSSTEMIYKYLQRLNNMKIIRYIPQKNNPVVFFREERLTVENLYISKKNYDFRKKMAENKLKAAIYYAETIQRCRSQILLQYFGEKGAPECGQCDYCIKKQKPPTPSLGEIETHIRSTLAKEPMLPGAFREYLSEHVNEHEEAYILKARELMENGVIVRNNEGKLCIKPHAS